MRATYGHSHVIFDGFRSRGLVSLGKTEEASALFLSVPFTSRIRSRNAALGAFLLDRTGEVSGKGRAYIFSSFSMSWLLRLVFGYTTFASYLQDICKQARRKYNPSFSDYVARHMLQQRLHTSSAVKQLLKDGPKSERLAFLDHSYVKARAFAYHERAIEGAWRGYMKRAENMRREKSSDLRVAFVAFVYDLYTGYQSRYSRWFRGW